MHHDLIDSDLADPILGDTIYRNKSIGSIGSIGICHGEEKVLRHIPNIGMHM